MRFFRLMAITVLLLACVALGAACAGAKGEEGPQGATGDTGATGVGIQNIVNNGNGTFTVNLTNGTAYTTDDFTGPKGEKGDAGTQGVQGIQGLPGPNMVAAMGKIAANGAISQGFNVTACTWHSEGTVYEITLTGITNGTDYVASATLGWGSGRTIQTLFDPGTGHLVVGVIDSTGNGIQSDFSFLVLDATL